jgi:hypothetical protein
MLYLKKERKKNIILFEHLYQFSDLIPSESFKDTKKTYVNQKKENNKSFSTPYILLIRGSESIY